MNGNVFMWGDKGRIQINEKQLLETGEEKMPTCTPIQSSNGRFYDRYYFL